ncbi:VOC family protein [Anaerocolumna xylanovorans]|nr:VOC family protein [Anaerocolumna xylanovorans]
MITGIDHFTINVLDQEQSDIFYSKILHFEKLETIDMGDSCITYYSLPGRIRLELINYYTKEPKSANTQKTLGCFRHLAFEVDNLNSYHDMFLRYNVPVIMPPTLMDKLHCRGMLIQDPNGVELELVEKSDK